jgi:hypothetical protein
MCGLRRDVGEKDQRRRQAAFMLVEVMLGNPRAVKAEALGVANLFGCQPVALLRGAESSRRVKNPGVYASCDLLAQGGNVGNGGDELAGVGCAAG